MDLSWVKDVERQLRVLAQRTAHLPTRVRGGGGGGGGGGQIYPYYEVDDEDELPNEGVPTRAFGRTRVTPEDGFFVRGESGWICLTHWR